ncbi:AtzE family amidohydrolase [Altererythrobacter sp. GH1-8]|uniref:AtzE family amidohydrolase n=1 Tax=Altererythrobacter sp. GH1-8 TaxID=3349333 RepID=UPI00374D95B3
MTNDLALLSASEIASGVRSKAFSAAAVARATLDRLEAINPVINAFTLVTAERALSEADAVDEAVESGRDPGPLAGVPYSVKNLFDLAGEVTVAGSIINKDYPPATADATSVARLKEAGAVCLGATNMGEYAYDFSTINSHYGATKNPHDLSRSAGGSSGGSGAAVAAGLGAFSLGTDTNGSVRVPSSFCGIWGLKPGYGRLSRAGAFLFAGSLDTIGVLGRSVADLAASADVIDGPDPRDPVCVHDPHPSFASTLDQGIDGLRIAKLGGYFSRDWTDEIADALEQVTDALGVTAQTELPNPELARAAAYTITAAEGGELHLERLKLRAADFDPSSRDRFIAGALAPTAWYMQAQRFRSWFKAHMAAVFEHHDVLVAPATPMVAPKLDQNTFTLDGAEHLLKPNIGILTQPITLIGLPVVAAPVHSPGRLPTAIQLIGRPGSEATLLRVARALEANGACAAPTSTPA